MKFIRRRKKKEPDIRQIIREELANRENEKKIKEDEETTKRLKREQFEKLPFRAKLRVLKKMEGFKNDRKK